MTNFSRNESEEIERVMDRVNRQFGTNSKNRVDLSMIYSMTICRKSKMSARLLCYYAKQLHSNRLEETI